MTAFYRTVDITDSISITCDNMKICANFYTIKAHRIFNVLEIIHMKILWNNFNNLVTSRYKSFTLIFNQHFNLSMINFSITTLPYHVTTCLKTFNMMSGNTYIYLFNFKIWIAVIA